jgi:hypothetical protein
VKKIFSLAIVSLLFLGFGCQQVQNNEEAAIGGAEDLSETIYTTFVINTHDWVNAEQSIDTLNKIIDLHEEYQLPVDIYLNDPVVQIYKEQTPELLERLKTSPFVAVSYHLRPPSPYYWDFDWLGFDKMNNKEIEATLRDYEEHEIDLATGEPTGEPGGYELLKNLMGYSPIVATAMGKGQVEEILAKIFKEKGAKFSLTHSGTTGWQEMKNGLWMRPEDLEVKVYEPRGRKSGEKILTEALDALPKTRPVFLNLKWHENNFYFAGTPWGGIYWNNKEDRGVTSPPWDFSKAGADGRDLSESEQKEQWQRYKECLEYVKNHPEIFTAINARDLAEMIE